MSLVDNEHFFHEDEIEAYSAMLRSYDLDPDDFAIEVTEDQDEVDMNDLDYVVMLYVKATHIPTLVSKTYSSTQDSGLWIKELEEDIALDLFVA